MTEEHRGYVYNKNNFFFTFDSKTTKCDGTGFILRDASVFFLKSDVV